MTTVSSVLNDLYERVESDIGTNFLIGRDISWMAFNKRVLIQSAIDNPLMERFKFLAISASNLDEFIMVRLASVKNRILSGIPDITGMSPIEEYTTLLSEIKGFKKEQENVLKHLTKSLEKANVYISKPSDLSEREKSYTRKIFENSIYPVILPIAYDSTMEFPIIQSKDIVMIVEITDFSKYMGRKISLLPLPRKLPKIYEIKSDDNKTKLVRIEDIIKMNIDYIFGNQIIESVGTIRVLRDSYTGFNKDTDIYVKDRVRENLNYRTSSKPIMMEVTNISNKCVKLLSEKLDVDDDNIFHVNNIDYSFIHQIPKIDNMYLYDKPFIPNEYEYQYDNIFDELTNNDMILHHPYDSYNPVIDFLQKAADDVDVLSIKQTLYRVSSVDSPIIDALCKAAVNGKHVSVVLELKARFDENQNLCLIDKLKKCGCLITFGLEHLKIHCKFISISKSTPKGIKFYTHIGTGNYNDKTAKMYTDISYLTSNRKIGAAVTRIFNMMSGFSDIGKIPVNGLFYAPFNIRSTLYKMIDKEVDIARMTGKRGNIIFKLNSLSDREMIRKIYWASRNNVHITIICRGVCSIKPMNNNIVIKSVIGRFLEHSRIYYFQHGDKNKVFISSADMLTRNLDKRVELLCPIRTPLAKEKVLNILSQYIKITHGDFLMSKNGVYSFLEGDSGLTLQDKFIENTIKESKM